MAMRWYVVHAFSQYEKKVAVALKERIERNNMQDYFGEIIVPTEEVVEMKGGQKRKSERKFFPGYVLVQMELNDDSWHLVKETPRVLGFIGGKADKPAPITEAEASAILQRVEAGVDQPRPKTVFEPGEMVRVIDGPFNDFNGVVEDVNYEKSRLNVAVLIFGRSTPVELEFGQVEKSLSKHGWASTEAHLNDSTLTRRSRKWGAQGLMFSTDGVRTRGEKHGKEDRRLHQAANPGRAG